MSEAVADKHIQTVVIGTSLEEGSDAVVRAGAALARAAGARVHLVHAVQMPGSYLSEVGPEGAEALLIAEQGRLRQEIGEQIERVGIEGGADVGRTLRSGVPHRVLPEVAAELGAELLVIGASEGRFQRLLGSAADRVLRRSSIPVLVVRGEMPAAPRRVLAPVDLSPLSGEALEAGLPRLAALAGGALPEVEVLFVLGVIQRQVAPQFSPEQVDRFAAEELERFVTRHAGGWAGQVKRKVRTGGPREEILAEVRETQSDLVLIGTHGVGGFDRFVIGSVASDVVREAPCSVLVVPPAAMRHGQS